MFRQKQWEEQVGLVEQIKPPEYALLTNIMLINICFHLTILTKAILNDSDSSGSVDPSLSCSHCNIFNKWTLLDGDFRKTSCGSQGEQQTEVKEIVLKWLKL